jgi:chromosome segregation protein
MYLSSIDLFGFKSFAQKTHINFSPGVTAIVGPNGCGKSNLVDALRWVLGEQREAALRSDRMENVIFGGTAKRRPLGMAEISLTLFDNQGILPVDYHEVTVTRRLFRSGKSEYLLNKVPCRLKDIVDLFMDTGLSPESYSIIELKMVEGIVTEDPSEMRSLLDEATGITRYKHRRREAQRRLDEAKLDRERALDILVEVEKQTNNLKKQVAKLRSYKRLQDRAHEIRIVIALDHIRHLEDRLRPLNTTHKELELTLELSTGELQRLEASLLNLEEELANLEGQRQSLAQNYQAIEDEFQLTSQQKSKLEESARLNEWQQRRNGEEQEATRIELKRIQDLLFEAEAAFNSANEMLPPIKKGLQERQNLFQQADNEFREARSRSAQARDQLNQIRSREAEAIRSTEHRKASISSLISRLAELNYRKEELQKALHHKNSELSTAEQEQKLKVKLAIENHNRYNDLKARLDQLRQKIFDVEKNHAAAKANQQQIGLQIQHYQDLHRRSSPLYPAGKIIADKLPKSISAVLTDELQTSEEYITAVETALQSMAFARTVRNETEFGQIKELLRGEKTGSAAILVGMPPQSEQTNSRNFITQVGGRLLSEVIEGTSENAAWIRHFVSSVVVMPSLDDLTKHSHLAAQMQINLVTPKGEFCNGEGVWIIGSPKDSAPVSAGVSVKLSQLTKLLHEADLTVRSEEDRANKLRRELTSLEQLLHQAELELNQADKASVSANSARLTVEAQVVGNKLLLDQVRSEIDEIPKRIDQLSEGGGGEGSELADVLSSMRDLENAVDLEVDAEANAMEKRELERQALAEEQLRYEKARLEVARLQDKLTDLQNRLKRSTDRYGSIEETITQLKADQIKIADDLEKQQLQLADSTAKVQDARRILEEIDLKRRDFLEEQRAGGANVRSQRVKLDEVTQSIHKLQLDRVEIEAGLQEERRKLPTGVNPDDYSGVKGDVESLSELEHRIIAMEPLNMAAEEEFHELQQRLDFLNNQLKDLEGAQNSLQQTISTLNHEARERFSVGFSHIRANFIKLFSEVFEGGQADMKLLEDDPLESRIELLANPAGKKIGSLALLSGGEKALTAISLLFAIYLEKPSPFCVLDEVDAPLDDVNTRRFCKLLEQFTSNTQFLVVTHNKRTMEIAQNLLGITMEDEGVSRVVPVQIELKS